jgi:hypothetical protein
MHCLRILFLICYAWLLVAIVGCSTSSPTQKTEVNISANNCISEQRGSQRAPSAVKCENILAAEQANSNTQLQEEILSRLGNGSYSFQITDEIVAEVSSYSPKMKSQWLSTLIKVYRQLPKDIDEDIQDEEIINVSPRRLADRIIFLLTRGDLFITNAIDKGRTPFQAYDDYLTYMSNLFEIKTPYTAKEVWKILQLLQSKVKDIVGDEDYADRGSYYVLGGSFANGRANMESSDIDVGGQRPGRSAEAPELNSIKRTVSAIFKPLNPRSTLHLEYHRVDEIFFALLQPVVFKITSRSIKFMIYPPAKSTPEQGAHFLSEQIKPVRTFSISNSDALR